MKTVLAIGDLHCGHLGGLTPPEWQTKKTPDSTKRAWDFFTRSISNLGSIDTVILNGDLIDGVGSRSGGTELIESDLDGQCEMAIDVIESIGADKVYITYGTPYHVSNHGSQEENKIAKSVNAVSISSHLFTNINGVNFNVRHKVGSSSVPHGRATSVAKEALWSNLRSQEGIEPKSDIILRSHVHYHIAVQDANQLSMTLPALQTPNTKFGLEQCSGIVDFGIVWFNIYNDGSFEWQTSITRNI